MSTTGIFNKAEAPGGLTGVQSTVCLSLEIDKVPSCFLYDADALRLPKDMKEASETDGMAAYSK
jgi:hypothetical protein